MGTTAQIRVLICLLFNVPSKQGNVISTRPSGVGVVIILCPLCLLFTARIRWSRCGDVPYLSEQEMLFQLDLLKQMPYPSCYFNCMDPLEGMWRCALSVRNCVGCRTTGSGGWATPLHSQHHIHSQWVSHLCLRCSIHHLFKLWNAAPTLVKAIKIQQQLTRVICPSLLFSDFSRCILYCILSLLSVFVGFFLPPRNWDVYLFFLLEREALQIPPLTGHLTTS